MSQRLQLLQVGRLARRSLGESTGLVVGFLASQAAAGGGYVDRGGRADLYYTSFALDALHALDAFAPDEPHAVRTRGFLEGFAAGDGLDFVHRACLARAWAGQPPARLPDGLQGRLLDAIAEHRSIDGGYSARRGADRGTAYGCFLGLNARADLRAPVPPRGPEADALAACVAAVRARDGGWANTADQAEGSTTATAAAVSVLRSLDRPVPPDVGEWILARRHPAGGFTAAPDAPIPDLLSTAVALHALDALEVPWRQWREDVLDFIDSLWTSEGAFHGSWADDHADCEYTFYGLVALGHASV